MPQHFHKEHDDMSKCNTRLSSWLVPALAAVAVAWPLTGQAQAGDVDPDALALLRKSTDYLAATKLFSLVTDTTIEAVLADGQKLQFGQRVAVTVQRPNKMRAERIGELISQTFYYDGQSLSVNLPAYKYYATAAVPATLDGMLDTARDKLNVIAPGADFVYANAYQRLTEGLTSAYVIGKAVIDGAPCDHVAFRNAEVDWQVWIQEGAKPVPRKFIVTSKKMPQSPQFTSLMSNWQTAPKVSAATFSFVPPKGAQKIDFVTMAPK
jgi:hypothetical protein